MNYTKVSEFIQKETRKQKISFYQLGARADVAYNTALKTRETEKIRTMSLSTLDKILGVLGYEIRVAIVRKDDPTKRIQAKLEAA